jgi:hypothetical protein
LQRGRQGIGELAEDATVGDTVTERSEDRVAVGRTVAGLALILGAAPVFLWLIPGHMGWTVILGGLATLGALVAGVTLAGGWLGVFRRRREQGLEQQGCLQLLVTLIVLLAAAVVLYYVVYYGAGAYLRGEL